jgi:hypothetical protein
MYSRYFFSALKSPVHLIVTAGVCTIALVSMNPAPALAALAADALWLLTAPLLPAYRARVDARIAGARRDEEEAQLRGLRNALGEADRQKYDGLAASVRSVREAYTRYSDNSKPYLAQLSERLDDMLARYLRMLDARAAYDRRLGEVDRADIARRLDALASPSGDERMDSINAKQRDILAQRLERLDKAATDRGLLTAQLDTLEQLMGLLREQAVTMRDPEELTGRLDALIGEIEATEKTVSDLEASSDLLFDRALRAAEQQRLPSADTPAT